MTKKSFLFIILILSALLIFASCNKAEVGEWTLEKVYALAVENGYNESFEDFISEFKGIDGIDGVGVSDATVNETGHLIITYTNSETKDAGLVVFTPDYEKITPEISENGNWFVGGKDTGVSAVGGQFSKWHTGRGLPEKSFGDVGDFYLSTETLEVYYKDYLSWNLVGDIKKYEPIHNSSVASEKAISEALLASVSIRCYINDDKDQLGAGVIYKLDKSNGNAYILTNYHVLFDEENSKIFENQYISVYLYGMEYKQYAISAEYIGGSKKKDLAILKISESDILKKSSAIEAKLGNSDSISVLDSVFAVGNPLGEGISATVGSVNIISEYKKNENGDELRVIRVDAAINGGNSGGGIFNVRGELVGIATMKIAHADVDNMAYAIPVNLAKLMSENILYYCEEKGGQNAKIFLDGILFSVDSAELDYDAETGKISKKEIVKISEIKADCVEDAKLCKVGDIISSVEISGVVYEPQFIYQLIEYRYMIKSGDTFKYNIIRDGVAQSIEISIPNESEFAVIE